MALMPARQAHAATASTTLNVSATVQTSCSVSTTNLAFGIYDAAATSDTIATSAVAVTCSLATAYNISLNGGNYYSSSRRMGTGSERLAYEIYRDVAMTGVFGLASASLGVSGIGTGLSVSTPIYGKIPKNQAVVPGSYSDQITVTVEY